MASWDSGRIRLTVTEDFSFSRGKLLLYSLILEMNYRISLKKKKEHCYNFFFHSGPQKCVIRTVILLRADFYGGSKRINHKSVYQNTIQFLRTKPIYQNTNHFHFRKTQIKPGRLLCGHSQYFPRLTRRLLFCFM